MVKSEMDWTQKLVEQCTHELVEDFDAWWAVLMGTHVHGCAARLCSHETLVGVSCATDLAFSTDGSVPARPAAPLLHL